MKLIVTGANGFIGSAIVEALLEAGHQVVAIGRSIAIGARSDHLRFVQRDFDAAHDKSDWLPLLDDVDAVINCAGILRALDKEEFEAVHLHAPMALAKACNEKGIGRFIQISALGHPEDGEFIASKHRFDQQLISLIPSATILRPSVVISLRGSYGGTSMLRGLAAFPQLLFLPGRGEQKIQPILLEDLAKMVVEAACQESRLPGIIELGGPDQVSIKEYLVGLRQWLKLPTLAIVPVPLVLIKVACRVGDRLKAGPLNSTILTMLESGNVVGDNNAAAGFHHKPRGILDAFETQTSFVQDRWHAKLFLLQPLIWILLSVIWLVSAVSGFAADAEQFKPILSAAGFAAGWHSALVMVTSMLDMVLGLLMLIRFKESLVLWLMLLSSIGYSSVLGVMAPELWLDPLGGLLKNLAVIPLILAYMVLRNPR